MGEPLLQRDLLILVSVHLWATMAAPLPGPRFRVAGLGGTFEVHGLDPQEAALYKLTVISSLTPS